MVQLHEEHLRRFVHVWRLALASSLSLPATDDPAYASLGALGRHVLSAAGGYMIWMCEALGLPDPGIRSAPKRQCVTMFTEELSWLSERDKDLVMGQPRAHGGAGRWAQVQGKARD